MGIVNGSLQEGYKNAAWFAANPTLVLLEGQKVNLEQTGTYKLGDGVTQLSVLTFLGASSGVVWGGITGTLSNQTDLQTALNNKEPLKGVDDNYVTDAQLVVIGNTSGTNTGDNATNTTSNSYSDGKVADFITNGVTTIAPSQNAVFDALALKLNITDFLLYEDLHAYHLSLNFADSTTYYFASRAGTAPATTNIQRLAFKKDGVITGADIYTSVSSTLASNEDITVSVRLNDTTDVLLSSSVKLNARSGAIEITGLSQAFAANDDWGIKAVMPAFVTNPAGPTITVVLHVKYN